MSLSNQESSWQELRFLALCAGVSIEHLCHTVEAATQFARESVGKSADVLSPFIDDDLEAVVHALWDDDFEIKQVLWDESEHPRDEWGRFTDSGIHAAARGERHYGPTSGSIEENPQFWDGGGAHRDNTTSQHFNGRFEIHISPVEAPSIDHLAHQMFNRALKPREWGELMGAPDGEKLEVHALPRAIMVNIQPETASPNFVTLIREVRLDDPHGLDASITAHLYDAAINKNPNAPKALAPRMMAYSIRKCQELGIKTIVSQAEGSRKSTRIIGYKYWPQLGFNADINANDRTKLGQIAPRFKTANTLLDLYAMPGGETAWEKVGGPKTLYFDTTDNSRSQQVLAAYLKSKGIIP